MEPRTRPGAVSLYLAPDDKEDFERLTALVVEGGTYKRGKAFRALLQLVEQLAAAAPGGAQHRQALRELVNVTELEPRTVAALPDFLAADRPRLEITTKAAKLKADAFLDFLRGLSIAERYALIARTLQGD